MNRSNLTRKEKFLLWWVLAYITTTVAVSLLYLITDTDLFYVVGMITPVVFISIFAVRALTWKSNPSQ